MDSGVLMLKEGHPEQIVPKVVRVVNPELKNRNIQVSRSILNTALAKNSSILLSDVQSDSFFREQASVVHSNIRSVMCVPLWNNEEIIGVVYADRASLLNQFTEDDLKLMTLLANLAAVKIENARLIEQALEKCRMDRELALAAQIQRNLLPKGSPDLESFEVCGGNRGCYEIGGDYYDFIPIAPGRLGIAIADVSGCGVGPALLMASLRASLHAEINPGYNLTGLAARLNGFVHQSSESHTFITFFFGELDTRTGELNYVNAGHNPPIVLDGADGVRRLESTGFCLGMFPDVSYESGTVRLELGDIACLFTDGITESRDRGEKGVRRGTADGAGPGESRASGVAKSWTRFSTTSAAFTDGCETRRRHDPRPHPEDEVTGRRAPKFRSRRITKPWTGSGPCSGNRSRASIWPKRNTSRSSCRSMRSASTSSSMPIPRGGGSWLRTWFEGRKDLLRVPGLRAFPSIPSSRPSRTSGKSCGPARGEGSGSISSEP